MYLLRIGGGILSVKDVDPSVNNEGRWLKKFIFVCSVCSLDKELWPYGRVTASISNIRAGRYPCGCGKVVKYTENQWKVIIERLCKTRGLIFLGWSGEFTGRNTKLKLHNPVNSNTWDTTNINNFIHNNAGCPKRGQDSRSDIRRKTVKSYLEDFEKELPNTLRFTPLEGEVVNVLSLWQVECLVCKSDEFSVNKISG